MKKKHLLVALSALLFPMGAAAQYTIYPIPQQIVAGTGTVQFTETVTVVCEPGIDQVTRDRVQQVLTEHGLQVAFADAPSDTQSNVWLGIKGSQGVVDQKATADALDLGVFDTANKFDRHVLRLSDAGSGRAEVLILGEHTNAAFFALASLEQMLDAGTAEMACVTLNDYADQQSRGLVEGYYGYPYTIAVKKDLMRYMMRYKMNTYLYGAKSDPYHSQKWKDAYPETLTAEQEKNGWLSQDMVRDISATSTATKVNFIWAIHPGNDFVYSGTVINDVMGKFEKMHSLGVRQFAVFVDDVGIPSSDADLKKNADNLTALQRAIEEKWNQPDAEATDTVRPLHFVPQIYCFSFAPNKDVHDRFFRALSTTPDYVTIYTTGGGVWSVPNTNDLNQPKEPLGRSVAWWWNYPCNDNADSQIYPMDMYSNFYDMPAVNNGARLPQVLDNGLGIVSNPMQQGEVAKTPLFSVADYAWNTDGFDNEASWQASFKAVLPGNEAAQQAYRFLAPYLRYNDPEQLSQLFNRFKSSKEVAELLPLMQEIGANCSELIKLKDSEKENEALLYNDLAPWLLKLQSMAEVTGQLLAIASDESTGDERWAQYIGGVKQADSLAIKDEYKVAALEGMGSGINTSIYQTNPSRLHWLPFIDYLKVNALNGYFATEAAPDAPVMVSNVKDASGIVRGTTTLSLRTNVTLQPGEFVGIQLTEPTLLKEISAADTLVQNYSVVTSPDGKQWNRLTQTELQPEDYVRYVAVVNETEAARRLSLNQRQLSLTLPTKPSVSQGTIPEGDVWQDHNESLMRDGNYNTFVCLNRVQRDNDTYMVKLAKSEVIRQVRIYMGTVNGDHMNEAKVQISADGKSWTTLNVLGTSSSAYTMDLPQVVEYSSEAKYCDFDGREKEAQYVRLVLTKPRTDKWLRLYEIEVNGEQAFAKPRCQDSFGSNLAQVSDRKPNTSTVNATKGGSVGTILYYFQDYALLNGLTLYTDPATMNEVTFEVSHDLKKWTAKEVDTASPVLRLAFSEDEANLAALRIKWKGNNAPAIYEIVETADAEKFPTVTEIEDLLTDAPAAADCRLTLENGRLEAQSALGIDCIEVFTLSGAKVLTQQVGGVQRTSLPVLAAGVLVVKVTLSDGSSRSFKVA